MRKARRRYIASCIGGGLAGHRSLPPTPAVYDQSTLP